MKDEENNPYLRFYTKHNISPVHQDISNFQMHLVRREKLYKTLGIPIIAFKDKSVLEVGSGGGYNTLAFLKWGSLVDIVEPNAKAQEEIPLLFKRYEIGYDRWRLFKCKVEEFNIEDKYDIIAAEGFIQCIPNKKEIIDKLCSMTLPGGVVVVTCADDISFFFEYLRRLVASKLLSISKINGFGQKVNILVEAFLSHLKTLKFASRPIEDWVIDNLMIQEKYGEFFSMAECIETFGNDFDFLGSSPNMFTDYSWYKDCQYKMKEGIEKQFSEKRHLLLMTGLEEKNRDCLKNAQLLSDVKAIRRITESNQGLVDNTILPEIIGLLMKIKKSVNDIDKNIPMILDEVIMLLQDDYLTAKKISNAIAFSSAFGRGQQYISMMKKVSHHNIN